ncbi:MAG: hypothetical protein U0529_01115 [Thermoanaerobaculia bacterium]
MTAFGVVLLVGIPLLVLLEGKRQERIYGKASARPNLAGVGLLELQKHLQADRRVETLVERVKDEAGETREDGSGEGPEAGGKEKGARPGALPR